jgi:DNA-binding NtrC family response regulator
MGLSKGALSKLERYGWSGNVRELQNCLMRAAVMTERPVIQAEDIPIEVEGWEHDPAPPVAAAAAAASPALNRRQQKAYATILARGRITRGDYQQIIGDDLPVRTAIYDLQDLVRKGVLKKTGSGPATAYVVDPRFTTA